MYAVGGGRVSNFPDKSITKMFNVIRVMKGWWLGLNGWPLIQRYNQPLSL